MAEKLFDWVKTFKAYLSIKENVSSSNEAMHLLNTHALWKAEKADIKDSIYSRFSELGQEIRSAKHETDISLWSFETPEDSERLEGKLRKLWDEELQYLYDNKTLILEDHFN